MRLTEHKYFISFWVVLLMLATACTTPKIIQNESHIKDVLSHREKAEQGLTIGERAPLSNEDLKDLRYFDIDKQYCLVAKVELAEGEEPFELPTYSGITKTFIKYATLSFELKGKATDLSVYRNLEVIRMPQYKNYLFLPFMDMTSGDITYGGGRYINLSTLDIKNGEVELDFNKCYNPWCAYSDGFNCPIPPAENTLDIEVHAGEKNYAGK